MNINDHMRVRQVSYYKRKLEQYKPLVREYSNNDISWEGSKNIRKEISVNIDQNDNTLLCNLVGDNGLLITWSMDIGDSLIKTGNRVVMIGDYAFPITYSLSHKLISPNVVRVTLIIQSEYDNIDRCSLTVRAFGGKG